MRLARTLVVLLLLTGPTRAQEPAPSRTAQEPGIQDNSFLIEESYNQEPAVVQHINSFLRSFKGKGWVYSFTQEWPVPGIKHQLSYSLLVASLGGATPDGTGLGDLALNYRYQLLGDGEAKVASAPRFTLILPTGDQAKGLGTGAAGIQLSLPVSVVLSRRFVTHFNIGATLTPSAKSRAGDKAGTAAYNLGHSVIWLISPRFNVMLETIWSRTQDVAGPAKVESSQSFFASPGIRWAYNFKSGLQIVPGLAIPVGLGPSRGDRSLLAYLSFEHPFKKRSSR